jgi:hypothetical protein
LILLDDSRRNPLLGEVLGLDKYKKAKESAANRTSKASRRRAKWTQGTRRCKYRGWDQFAAELRRLLEFLDEDPERFVIVAATDRHRFVQFAAGEGNTLRGEAVSNHFLEADEQLDRETVSFLGRLGWKRPTKTRPNFWQTWPTSAGTRRPAAVAVRTLKEAFGIASPALMTIICQSFA